MTDKTTQPEAVVAALQSSGFPFQTAVAHTIQAEAPHWRVHASEDSWQTTAGEPHFLDLVATNGVIYLTIECKKTRKEILTFLRPVGTQNTGLVSAFRCLRAFNTPDRLQQQVFCETWELYPRSNVSEFCVVSTSDSGKDQRLLERDAGLLVHATDAFAHDLAKTDRELPLGSLIIPVIVTNAPIYTARYQPSLVSLETGRFTKIPEDVTQPQCVRFEKGFPSVAIQDLGDRTVFVVNALSFVEFLSRVGPEPGEFRGKASVNFQRYRDLRPRGLGAG